MSVENVNNPSINAEEAKRAIVEAAKLASREIENPALKRAVGKEILDPDDIARQAYDRMHHRHNRS